MSEKQETIADIVAEKRERADEIERDVAAKMASGEMVSDQYAREVIADLRMEADRIEAAAKREELRWATANGELARILDLEKPTIGNAAAMREASEKCVDLILRFGNAELDETPLEVIIDIEAILKAARSAPPRNCDVGTPEERLHRYHELCREISYRYERIGEHAPSFAFPTAFEWEDRPYEEGGAK